MQNGSNQPQAPSESERGYAPQQPEEYHEEVSPQSGYPQQPYTSYYQGQQQQYWNQQWYGRLAPGDVSPFEGTSMGMRARTAGMLCYLFAWVGGLVFFLVRVSRKWYKKMS